MKNPFRFWMSGGAATILAAFSGGHRSKPAADFRTLQTRVSRFGLAETVARIEASARRHGLPVLARLRQPRLANVEPQSDEPRLLIVLESSEGGTPVSMDNPNAPPELLLSLEVCERENGATEVWLPSSSFDDLPDDMTPGVKHDMAELSTVVDEALQP